MLRPDTEVTGIAYQLREDAFTFITPLSLPLNDSRTR